MKTFKEIPRLGVMILGSLSMIMILLAMVGIAIQGDPLTVGDRALLNAVHDAFLANQAAFDHGEVEFNYVQGTSRNVEDARGGDFQTHYEGKGLYAFDGTNFRYDIIFSDEDMRNTSIYIDASSRINYLDSYRMVANESYTLLHKIDAARRGGTTKTIKLYPGGGAFDRDFQFPLAVGRPNCVQYNLAAQLRKAFDGDPGYAIENIDANAEIEGKMMLITLRYTYGLCDFWIDIERGAVPIRIVERSEGGVLGSDIRSVAQFDDIRLVPDRGWLPFRLSWWYASDNVAGQLAITSANFDERPGRESFTLVFDEPVSIVDDSKEVRYLPRQSWNINDFHSGSSREVEKVQFVAPGEPLPELPGERTSRFINWTLVLGLLGFVITVALAVFSRKLNNG